MSYLLVAGANLIYICPTIDDVYDKMQLLEEHKDITEVDVYKRHLSCERKNGKWREKE